MNNEANELVDIVVDNQYEDREGLLPPPTVVSKSISHRTAMESLINEIRIMTKGL
jgi:hypothetical protein